MSRLELFYVVVSCWHIIDVYRKLPQSPNQIKVCHDLDSFLLFGHSVMSWLSNTDMIIKRTESEFAP